MILFIDNWISSKIVEAVFFQIAPAKIKLRQNLLWLTWRIRCHWVSFYDELENYIHIKIEYDVQCTKWSINQRYSILIKYWSNPLSPKMITFNKTFFLDAIFCVSFWFGFQCGLINLLMYFLNLKNNWMNFRLESIMRF